LTPVRSHVVRVTLKPQAPDLRNASGAIGSENKGKHLRHGVVEFLAIPGIGMPGAVGTRRVYGFRATATHLAPFGLFVGLATWAPLAQIRPTGPAIEAAARYQTGI